VPDAAGKAKRVTGVFVFMVGAGCILDCHALWAGGLGMVSGVALFVWGALGARLRARAISPGVTANQPAVSTGQSTEGSQ
jgi:hypothetical protein